MRISPRKVVTWIGTVFLFSMISFNLYYRHVWVFESQTRPWGNDFDSHFEHSLFHHPRFQAAARHGFTFNVTTERHFQFQGFLSSKTTYISSKSVWPNVHAYEDDRIMKQLTYRTDLKESDQNSTAPLKNILLYAGIRGWQVKKGRQTFMEQKCQVNTCSLTENRLGASTADAILFHHTPSKPWTTRPANQLWILFMLESPYHTPALGAFNDVFNITATYRHDSDIVAPYEKFVPYDNENLIRPQNRSYAAGKTKKVAWFVSNCGARNRRRDYANELSKYISVDIYGSCGSLKCPRRDANKCFEMLNKDYKFYLSFENSNCRDYITEKFFVTGLQHDVIPVVMGGAPEDYKRAAPPHSYIHVDDFESPKHLAQYLHLLDENDHLYNEYFQWKGSGRFIDTLFWCRVCAMVHDTSRGSFRSYKDLDSWWRGPEVCIGKDSWNQHPRQSKFIHKENLLT